jgi:trehalose 6-phosphate synthase
MVVPTAAQELLVQRLVCVSNRVSVPRRSVPAGGLTAGVLSALEHVGGMWFGWSGETRREPLPEPEVVTRERVRFATIDLEPEQFDRYYNGYCNGSLWPLFHYFAGRFRHEQADRDAYHAVNARFAAELIRLLRPDDVVWVHDYHLIPLARYLRRERFAGPIGFFLHIPFPHLQVLRVLPGYEDLLDDFCRYDLVGFQTEDDRQSFESCVGARHARLGVYPIGVEVDEIAAEARATASDETVKRMTASLLGRRLIVGVDRLDYSKGLTERFAAFEHFLTEYPDNQGKVTFLQIAPLSRENVPAYGEIRRALEQMAGRLNGRLAEADWTPVRYLNRNYSHATLMGFLRAAQVALVTPVRDGMNLVAKEFVAAQNPEDPGVLILSSLAGAARELGGALEVNPYDKPEIARALRDALHMPLSERRYRHHQLLAAVRRHDIHNWYRSFLGDLALQSASPESAATHGRLHTRRPGAQLG